MSGDGDTRMDKCRAEYNVADRKCHCRGILACFATVYMVRYFATSVVCALGKAWLKLQHGKPELSRRACVACCNNIAVGESIHSFIAVWDSSAGPMCNMLSLKSTAQHDLLNIRLQAGCSAALLPPPLSRLAHHCPPPAGGLASGALSSVL